MKCYNHHDRDAFGISIITGKALCLECMEEYKGFIIEKGSETSKIAVEKLRTGYSQMDMYKLWAIFYIIIGLVLLFLNVKLFIIKGKLDLIFLIFPVLFLLIGIIGYKKLPKNKK